MGDILGGLLAKLGEEFERVESWLEACRQDSVYRLKSDGCGQTASHSTGPKQATNRVSAGWE